jgi:hypothetical protein
VRPRRVSKKEWVGGNCKINSMLATRLKGACSCPGDFFSPKRIAKIIVPTEMTNSKWQAKPYNSAMQNRLVLLISTMHSHIGVTLYATSSSLGPQILVSIPCPHWRENSEGCKRL